MMNKKMPSSQLRPTTTCRQRRQLLSRSSSSGKQHDGERAPQMKFRLDGRVSGQPNKGRLCRGSPHRPHQSCASRRGNACRCAAPAQAASHGCRSRGLIRNREARAEIGIHVCVRVSQNLHVVIGCCRLRLWHGTACRTRVRAPKSTALLP